MKILSFSGNVGMEISVDSVGDALKEAGGDDLTIDLYTLGGNIYAGLQIHNQLRDYAKRNNAKITARLGGIVASAGSIIAAGCSEIVALPTSTFFIHNAQGFAFGDSRVLLKESVVLEAHNEHLARVLSARAGKALEELITIMNADSWYYGAEIVEAGFADVLEGDDEDEKKIDPANAIALARIKVSLDREKFRRVAAVKSVDVKTKEGGINLDEKELFQNMTLLLSTGGTSAEGILNHLGLKSQLRTKEHVNALSVVDILKEKGIDDPVAHIDGLQAKIDEGKATVRAAALDKAFGDDAKGDNLLRKYADGKIVNATKEEIEAFKADPVAKKLAAENIDINAPGNYLGAVDSHVEGGAESGARKPHKG